MFVGDDGVVMFVGDDGVAMFVGDDGVAMFVGDDGAAMFVKIKDRERITATSKIRSPAHEQCPLHIGGDSNLKHILIKITDLRGT